MPDVSSDLATLGGSGWVPSGSPKYGGAIPAAIACTWANRPTSGLSAGQLIFVTDLGEYGTVMQWTGLRWRALNGAAALKTLGAQTANIGAAETIVLQALIPAGAWQVNDSLRIFTSMTKSGAVDSGNLTYRVGTAGTTADTAVASITSGAGAPALAAANLTGGFIHEFKLASLTNSLKVGAQFSAPAYGGAFNGAIQAPIAIPDAGANALFVSVSISSSGATNTVNMQSGQIQLITP